MNKLFLIAGPCIVENSDTPLIIGKEVKSICDELGIDAGRKIRGTVTKVEGSWLTVVEVMGSCYKLPRGAVKLCGNNVK